MSSYSFLTVGKTVDSAEAGQGSFKRYVGLASSYVLAVNPDKATLEKLYGTDQVSEPEYVKDGENGKEVHLHFIVKTDPAQNNEIEIMARAMFTLRNTPAYNKDQTTVQVIDKYGNFTWATVEEVKAKEFPLLDKNGNPKKIDQDYRMARVGECALIEFLKNYLCIKDAFTYSNGKWVKKGDKEAEECVFGLDNIKDYFKGDFSELRDALALQPNNKIKLLYGVRTTEDNKQYQTVCTREQTTLRNNAGAAAIARVEQQLANLKSNGSFPTTDFKVQELQEWTVEPSNLDTPTKDSEDIMPWD